MFTEILERYVATHNGQKNKVSGAAYVVVDRDGIISSDAAGTIGPDIGSAKLSQDTPLPVLSMTKLLTATSVMQVVERGNLDLDDDVRSIVPELTRMNVLRGFNDDNQPILESIDQKITLRMLLTHTSGLPYDRLDPALAKWADAVGRDYDSGVNSIHGFQLPCKFRPGEGWVYGVGVDWAGIVLERVTRQRLDDYMRQNIFQVVGMKNSGFRPQNRSSDAEVSIRLPDGTLQGLQISDFDYEVDSGGSGCHSTANDYANFLSAMLLNTLINEETRQQLFRPQLTEMQRLALQKPADKFQRSFAPDVPAGTKVSYSLAGLVHLEDVPGKRRKGSISWSSFQNSRWWIDPSTGVAGVMILTCLPWGDEAAGCLWDELQSATYKMLHGRSKL